MKKYLVGGAVRDHQLGIKAVDRDWLIVGAKQHNIDKLIRDGYEEVGNDFPVFLHPVTGEEYALARTERKTGVGYNGFTCNSDPSVTLEEDLMRRDLTINAMAFDPYSKELFDPYGGQNDLKNKILRHVSPAYAEDPVRVLRTARFAARYNFNVHPDTNTLMMNIANAGELANLTSERVVTELKKVAEEDGKISKFFKVLRAAKAMDRLFPGAVPDNAHLDIIDKATSNASKDNIFDILLASWLSHFPEEVITKIHKKYKLPTKTHRFIMDARNLSFELLKVSKMSPEDAVRFFDRASLRNKGGEAYMYLLLDIQTSLGNCQRNDYDNIAQYYDQFYSTDLSNLDELCKKNGSDWVKTSLKPYIFEQKCTQMKKMQ